MKKYKEPKINISKVYTKSGDSGKTHLIGGEKVSKDDLRVVAYGEVDELNVTIGFVVFYLKKYPKIKNFEYINTRLLSIQNELFNLGTVLASIGADLPSDLPEIQDNDILILEDDIDGMNDSLEPLKSFVLPGGNDLILQIHSSRVVCRRTERNVATVMREYPNEDIRVLKYLNRLSDYLFVLGRWVSKHLNTEEKLWNPNNISSNKNSH